MAHSLEYASAPGADQVPYLLLAKPEEVQSTRQNVSVLAYGCGSKPTTAIGSTAQIWDLLASAVVLMPTFQRLTPAPT